MGAVHSGKVEEFLLAELTDIGIRTIGDLARDGAFDHYVLASEEDARWMTLGLRDPREDTGQVDLSRELLGDVIRSATRQLPKVFRYGGREGAPKLTRMVLRLNNGDLLVVALQGWLNAWVARKLANAIERQFMPARRPVVFLPDPGWYVGPQRHGFGTQAITTAAMALNSWQRRASRRLRLPAH